MKKYARLRSTSCSFPEQFDSEEPEADVDKWNRTLKLSPPVHVTKLQGHEAASCSSSHRVLADALKKLSSLRETQYDDDPLPRAGLGAGSDQLHSIGFVSGSNWPRPRSAMGGAAAAGRATVTSHRRSSSMHDVIPEARASTSGLDGTRKLSEQISPQQLRTAGRRLPHVTNLSKSCSLWEESEERWSGRKAGAVQSLRYDRLQTDPELESRELQSQSVREGAAHAQAIAAMAKAYAEKYGVAQAVVECVACGRGLGVIVEGNSPGSYDSSFCRSCRPPLQATTATPAAAAAAAAATPSSSSSWKRGMVQYCRKLLLRMGKKPSSSHKYTMV